MKNTTISRKTATHKIVDIVACEIKHNGYIVYTVRSATGKRNYTTTIAPDGHATGCTCPARKPCYHMTQLSEIEMYLKKAVAAPREEVVSTTTMYDYYTEETEEPVEHWLSYNTCPTCGIEYEWGTHECEAPSVVEEAEQVLEAAQIAHENAEVEVSEDYSDWLEGFAAYVLSDEQEEPQKQSTHCDHCDTETRTQVCYGCGEPVCLYCGFMGTGKKKGTWFCWYCWHNGYPEKPAVQREPVEQDPFAWWHAMSVSERENATANYEMKLFPF